MAYKVINNLKWWKLKEEYIREKKIAVHFDQVKFEVLWDIQVELPKKNYP